mgnify:CR=1 FL=1
MSVTVMPEIISSRKLGLEATPKNLNDYKLKKAHEEKVAAENLAAAKALAAELEKASVASVSR